jgi:glycerate 2-kinase
MNDRELAIKVFNAGIEAVKPDRLICEHVRIRPPWLEIGSARFDLCEVKKIHVIGAGKASGLMAQALEHALGDGIETGTVVVKYGHACACRKIQVLEAGHPYPDDAGVEATRKIVRLCREAGEGDLVLCLWSGGGSALLADYPAGCSLEEWIAFSKTLVNSGATIAEINSVRKHLSAVKGGQLARLAHPAHVVSMALSDVVGDPLDVIASGPTVADTSTFAQAEETMRRYGLSAEAPRGVLQRLAAGVRGEIPETPKPGDPLLSRTTNMVIGNNRMALEAGLEFARQHGCEGVVITDRLEGDTNQAAQLAVPAALDIARDGGLDRLCLLFGGETNLKVAGTGLGGRNQHLALAAAKLLRGVRGVTLLAGGTDGTDGPTDAAGAVVDGTTWERALEAGIDPQKYLENFNSYEFFQQTGGHVFTGPTMTNVMDMVVVVAMDQLPGR